MKVNIAIATLSSYAKNKFDTKLQPEYCEKVRYAVSVALNKALSTNVR